jgi:hypothetical protein
MHGRQILTLCDLYIRMYPLPALDLDSENVLFLYLKVLNNEVLEDCMYLIEFSVRTNIEPKYIISFHCAVCQSVARRLLLREKINKIYYLYETTYRKYVDN